MNRRSFTTSGIGALLISKAACTALPIPAKEPVDKTGLSDVVQFIREKEPRIVGVVMTYDYTGGDMKCETELFLNSAATEEKIKRIHERKALFTKVDPFMQTWTLRQAYIKFYFPKNSLELRWIEHPA
jgi:hypothetical protein